jgi:hypothetical protein
MKKIVLGLFTVALMIVSSGTVAFGLGQYASGSTGVDISYPNCKIAVPKVSFGVVGVTGGLVYSHNTCLRTEASFFKNLSLYVNTGLNTASSSQYYQTALDSCGGEARCAAYAYGYNAAKDAMNYAASQNVTSGSWWLDVETMNTWNSDTVLNQQSVAGSYDALRAAGIQNIGVYSTTAQWQTITGGWKNGWPSWGATTWTTAKQAATYCTGHEFSGGPSYLMQFKSKRSKVDQDYAC